ncbi:MAG: 50S ribosomal protein L37ae [Promethearchaeia archaeon]
MARRTKKVGSTGRLGARYGSRLRRAVYEIEARRAEPHRCPSCATRALKRKAAGLWICRKCGLRFAGGAYVPFTDAGKAAQRAIAQRISGDFLALKEEGEEELDFLPNVESDEMVAMEEAIAASIEETPAAVEPTPLRVEEETVKTTEDEEGEEEDEEEVIPEVGEL